MTALTPIRRAPTGNPICQDGTPAIVCACCNHWNHREDFYPLDFEHAETLEDHFGGPVCGPCMDDQVICEDGQIMSRDDAYCDDEGRYWAATPFDADDYGDWLFERAKDRRMDEEMER